MGWPCPTCDRELSTRRGMRQHHTKVHGEPLLNRRCTGCGAAFYDEKARRSFCDDCNPNAGQNNGNWKGGKELAECRECGAEFAYYPSNKEGYYCPTCVEEDGGFLGEPYRKDAETVETACRYCDVLMKVLQSELLRGRGRFCSRTCFAAWLSENIVGEAHHQWEGGPIRYGRRWWRIRRRALERDEHACQRCGKTRAELGREPDVHHLQPVRTFDDAQDAHTLDNVVCLCRSCHREVEDRKANWHE